MRELVTLVIQELRRQAAYVNRLRVASAGSHYDNQEDKERWSNPEAGFSLGKMEGRLVWWGSSCHRGYSAKVKKKWEKTIWLLPVALQSPTSASHCLDAARSQLTWSLGNIVCVGSGFLSFAAEKEEEEIESKQNQNWHTPGRSRATDPIHLYIAKTL